MRNTSFKLNRQPKKKNYRLLLTLLVLGVALITAGLLFYKYRGNTQNSGSDSSIQSSEDDKLATGNNKNGDIKQNSNSPSQPEPKETNALSAKISSFSQQNGKVTAVANVSSSQVGKCTFSFSSLDSRPVSREVNSSEQESNQQCSATIPEVEFDKLGEWNLAVIFITGNSRATVEQKVIIK